MLNLGAFVNNMKLERYRPILYITYLFLTVDLLINSCVDFLHVTNVIHLLLYVIQDACLVFSLIMLFLVFFSTYVFQAGLISLLLYNFRFPIATAFMYIALTLALHIWNLTKRWDNTEGYVWTSGLLTLFIIQRTVAVLYYYLNKRIILHIADPRFHTDTNWIQQELSKRH